MTSTYSMQRKSQASPLLSPTSPFVSYPPTRKTVPPVRSAANIVSAVAKRTIAVVLTVGSETVPGTAKRGLPAIGNAKRTATTTAVTATVVIRHATATTSATTRIGSTATGTACISWKALPAPTWISQIQHFPIVPLRNLLAIAVLRKSPISSLTPTLRIISATVLLRLVAIRSATSRFVKVVVCLSISAVLSAMPSILRVAYMASILPFSLRVASFSST